jgi:hypothetical protein
MNADMDSPAPAARLVLICVHPFSLARHPEPVEGHLRSNLFFSVSSVLLTQKFTAPCDDFSPDG